MRAALILALWLLSPGAHAQAPQVDRIDVSQFGTYTKELVHAEAAPGTPAGTLNIVTNVRLVAQTRTIPAQKGVGFGFRFVVVGAPAGALVPLRAVTIFPAPMTNPATQRSEKQEEADISLTIGTVAYRGYSMDSEWEVLPGVWRFQIWYHGRKLAEEAFTVQRP
jgi:hypothetical protein